MNDRADGGEQPVSSYILTSLVGALPLRFKLSTHYPKRSPHGLAHDSHILPFRDQAMGDGPTSLVGLRSPENFNRLLFANTSSSTANKTHNITTTCDTKQELSHTIEYLLALGFSFASRSSCFASAGITFAIAIIDCRLSTTSSRPSLVCTADNTPVYCNIAKPSRRRNLAPSISQATFRERKQTLSPSLRAVSFINLHPELQNKIINKKPFNR